MLNNNLIDLYLKIHKQPDDKIQTATAVNNQKYKPDIAVQSSPELDKSVKSDYSQVSKTVALVQPKIQPFINQVNYYNRTINTYAAKSKGKDDVKGDIVVSSTGSIPFIRRFSGIWYAYIAHDYFKALGKAAVLINNVPEDTRDIGMAVNELKGIKSEIPTSFQIPFSNFRGTFLNKPLKKMIESKNEVIKKFGDLIHNTDITFDRTKTGYEILKLIGVKDSSRINTKKLNIYGSPIAAKKYEGTFPAEFTGKSFMRIPMLTLYLFYTFELPAIYKAFKQSPKEGLKQIAKSFMSVNALIFGTAIGGAAGSYKGAVTGLVGMSVGSYAGFKLSKWINKQIDNT